MFVAVILAFLIFFASLLALFFAVFFLFVPYLVFWLNFIAMILCMFRHETLGFGLAFVLMLFQQIDRTQGEYH